MKCGPTRNILELSGGGLHNMSVTKAEKKRIGTWKHRIEEHQQKIQDEKVKDQPNWGLVQHWEKEIAGWEKQIAHRERRLRLRKQRG
jgi:hypothetical protein